MLNPHNFLEVLYGRKYEGQYQVTDVLMINRPVVKDGNKTTSDRVRWSVTDLAQLRLV